MSVAPSSHSLISEMNTIFDEECTQFLMMIHVEVEVVMIQRLRLRSTKNDVGDDDVMKLIMREP